jgi:ubiquinone/menaquinone biosynthesis C-methylase UbiE
MAQVNSSLQSKYDDFYTIDISAWRKAGAVQKGQNIMELASSIPHANVIEIGAGDGSLLRFLDQNDFSQKFTAVEISKSGLEKLNQISFKNRVDILLFDGYKLPYEDGEFDLAYCSHVMEHVEHPRLLMTEIKRISKRQIFEVPIDFSFSVDQKFDHFYDYGHINIYTPSLFKFLLKTAGFDIDRDKNGMYPLSTMNFGISNFGYKGVKSGLKLFLWNLIPALKRNKPNTYTVLTH